MSVAPEAKVAQYLREWLLLQLPAKVTEVNGLRNPVVKSPRAGPYTVTNGMVLRVGKDPSTLSNVTPTVGSQTAAQIAASINAVVAGIASSDSDGRVVLTGDPPSSGATGIYVGQDNPGGAETGSNALFGWNPGGEFQVCQPLEAPAGTGVCDGWPVVLDCGPGFWVIIGKRVGVPVQPGDVRRDQHLVAIELTLLLKETNIQNSRSREAIQSAVRCLREVLLTDRGRMLGRDGQGDVMKFEEKTCIIPGTPWMARDESGQVLGIFDTATYAGSVRVFERPATS